MARERTEAQMKAQEEMDRRRHERREATRVAHERIGLPLICCEQVCRRARRCLGRVEDGEYDLLPCLWHYREEMRFLMLSPHGLRSMLEEAERLGIVPPFDPAAEEAEAASPAPTDSTARGRRPREPTLIEIVFGSGAALARLRKPKGTWRPPSWEEDPERFERRERRLARPRTLLARQPLGQRRKARATSRGQSPLP
jgi:hypothetical protein